MAQVVNNESAGDMPDKDPQHLPETAGRDALAAEAGRGVPIIFTRRFPRTDVGLLVRGLAALFAGGALTLLVIASQLPPSPSGVGTHEAMGLEPCRFLQVTGVPCASCGSTTAFAHYVRGSFFTSFYVQPLGFLIAVLATATVVSGTYVATTGRPVYRLLRFIPSRYYVIPIIVYAIGSWGWKMVSHLAGI